MFLFVRSVVITLFLAIIFNGTIRGQENNKRNKQNDAKTARDRQEYIKDRDSNEQEKEKNSTEIIITATKTEINKRETGASITVISSDEIEHSQKMNLVDVLKNTPGISLSQSSSLGGIADLYIRGTQSNHVIVLVDGVKVNNPTSPTNGFDWANITTDNIERIEIIRGSQSTLYGSDAIGGVVNIITKKGKGDPQLSLMTEGGSYKTFKELVGVSGGTDKAYYSFAVSREDSSGITRTSSWRGITKSFVKNGHDGYRDTSVSSRLGIETIHDSWLSLAIRYTGSVAKIADSPYQESKNHPFGADLFSTGLNYSIPVFSWWESNLSLSYLYQSYRDRENPSSYAYAYNLLISGQNFFTFSNSWFRGQRITSEFKNKFKIMNFDEIICGASYETENAAMMPFYSVITPFGPFSMDPLTAIDKSQDTWAAYAQNHLKLLDRIFIIAGIRYTKPDYYDYHFDYSLSGSFILPGIETRLKANLGSGYKTPSLYERFYNYTQYNNQYLESFVTTEQYLLVRLLPLKPERSLSWDTGIEQPLWNKKISIEVNWFTIKYDPMVFFNSLVQPLGYYMNINALLRGVECIASFKPIKDLIINAFYTYTRSYNESYQFSRGDMLRIPRHKTGTIINYTFLNNGNLNLSLTYLGKRRDYWSYPFASYMNPYFRLDLATSWKIVEQLQAFFRIENLLNKKYEEVRGYRMPGISFFGGLKVLL